MDIKDWFTGLAVVVFVGFCGYQWWPIKTSKYTCDGALVASIANDGEPAAIVFELAEYPWWMIWSSSDGWVRAAGQDVLQIYQPHLEHFGEEYEIRSAEQGDYEGNFSTFSYRLDLYFGERRFEGSCTPIS